MRCCLLYWLYGLRSVARTNQGDSMKKIIIAGLMLAALTGCTRISTGEVGLRVNFDRTVSSEELQPGSINQTLLGDVLKFPVKEIAVDVQDLQPLAADNSTMKDFDLTVVYSINPASVSDLWTNKSRSFHGMHDGETILMNNYLQLTARNAVFKVARKYAALGMNDARPAIETEVMATMKATLEQEKLVNAVQITQVQVKSIVPSDAVKLSADSLVRAQNENKQKEVEVGTAKLEAERIAALNANAGAIGYMAAMAQMKIAEGIASGKVQTVVIPYDFKGMVNIGAK